LPFEVVRRASPLPGRWSSGSIPPAQILGRCKRGTQSGIGSSPQPEHGHAGRGVDLPSLVAVSPRRIIPVRRHWPCIRGSSFVGRSIEAQLLAATNVPNSRTVRVCRLMRNDSRPRGPPLAPWCVLFVPGECLLVGRLVEPGDPACGCGILLGNEALAIGQDA